MVIRVSHKTVWLNGRLVCFPRGSSAVDAYASLSKHSPKDCNTLQGVEDKRGKALAPHVPLDHPLEALAQAIAWRLANPTNHQFMQRPIKRAKGSNGRKTIVKNDGKLYGYATRTLSESDIQEIRGVCALELSKRGNPENFDFGTWKALFSESRKVLGMKRKVYRESLLDSLDTIDFHSELSLDAALIQSLRDEREEEQRREEARKAHVHESARQMIKLILAARRADHSRKAVFNKLTACRYLRAALKCESGQGHGHALTRTAAYKSHNVFLEYIAKGEAQLALESEEANARAQWEESARLMYAVAE